MKEHGINPGPERPVYSEFVPDFAALEQVSLPAPHTVLLIVADVNGVSDDLITRVAERFLRLGLIYVCVWGPDCERVHDLFDWTDIWAEISDDNTESGFTLMSTGHSNESLEEAIWFFLVCAIPPDTETEKVSYFAVTVGSKDWAAVVDSALSDVSAFSSRMVDETREPSGSTS